MPKNKKGGVKTKVKSLDVLDYVSIAIGIIAIVILVIAIIKSIS
jgi:DMSO/TMAO reductase YedYZ heme-binding membrane subunit|tara:strand:- start:872 stop:1003 length:132 start_codon:yes stop_codon:yes gene_type:complete